MESIVNACVTCVISDSMQLRSLKCGAGGEALVSVAGCRAFNTASRIDRCEGELRRCPHACVACSKAHRVDLVEWVGQFQRSVHGPGHDDRCC